MPSWGRGGGSEPGHASSAIQAGPPGPDASPPAWLLPRRGNPVLGRFAGKQDGVGGDGGIAGIHMKLSPFHM